MSADPKPGKVTLVGAGPGDPELLTLKAARCLRVADVVFYDALANPALLELAPPTAELIPVGKRAALHLARQPDIAQWMIARARAGARVVRLKGGDPMIFGRGGEEIAALAEAGVAWEVVPGVSAANGAAAAAGIPLTHRDVAHGVRLVSAASAGATACRETAVVYMGLERIAAVAAQLQQEGYAASTPVAAVQDATLPSQRIVTGTLADIAAGVARARLRAPVVLIAGDVVGWRERLPAPRLRAGPPPPPAGVILIAHGSPLPEWHAGVERLAASLAAPGHFARAAYLPPAQPDFESGVDAAVESGVAALAVVPYFLAPGLHVTRDLPALLDAARVRHPGLRLELAPCLEGHPALRTAVLARATDALDRLAAAAASTVTALAPPAPLR